MIEPELPVDDEADAWIGAGEAATQAICDIANLARDKADEKLDAMRVHNGMTLDEFLAKK